MPNLTIALLGPFEVRLDGVTVTGFESVKVRALLAYLAAEAGRPHSRATLAGLLWPDWPEEAAAKNLRHTLYSLRKTLGEDSAAAPFIQSDRQFITFQPGETCQVDVLELEKALAAASGPQTADLLRSAVGLYKGSFLEGFSLNDSPAFEEWVLGRREHHSQQMLQGLGRLADWHEGTGEYALAEAYARRQLEIEPWREKAHQQLMRVMALRGERVAALAQFEALQKVLKAELGVQPSPETVQLYEQIRDGKFSAQTQTELPVGLQAVPEKPHHNLPLRLSSFIGREKEIEQVKGLVTQQRLVTLTGSGGVGKTSLALQTASEVLDVFLDGVWLVELAPLTDGELLPEACKQALDMIEEPGVPTVTRLLQFMEHKHLLLVLDNCEHLIAACTALVERLLKVCPHLHILATSREALALPGERLLRVPSMHIPESQILPRREELLNIDSMRLFVERAAQVSPDFGLNDDNAQVVAQVVQRLDGIPLAIELAAARMRMLSVGQIASRLDDAFRLLSGSSRATLPRQQTLRACIEWSYKLLSPKERLLLQRLSVFAGVWGLEAAEAVCADTQDESSCTEEVIGAFEVLDLLAGLVDKSLVLATAGEHVTRYRMLEMIRQYAGERLQETGCGESVRHRHLVYYAWLTGEAVSHLRGNGQVEWLDRMEAELDNLRLAMDRSLSGQIELGLKIAADLHWFWWIRGFLVEGSEWHERLLAAEQAQRPQNATLDGERLLERARALCSVAPLISVSRGLSGERYQAYLQESLQILRRLGPSARHELGISLWKKGNLSLAEENEMLEIFHQANDSFNFSEYSMGKSFDALERGEFSQAKSWLEESLALARQIDDRDGMSTRMIWLGMYSMYTGDYARAADLVKKGLETIRIVGNAWWAVYHQAKLIEIYLAQGDYAEATRLAEKALAEAHKIARNEIVIDYLGLLQAIAWSQGNYARATQLGQDGIQIGQENPIPRFDFTIHYYLGRTALSQGDFLQAEKYLGLALADLSIKAKVLPGCAVLFCRQGKHLQAARIFAATHIRFEWERLGLPLRERSEHDEALAATRLALGEEAFAAAWAEGQALTLEQALAYAQETLEA